MKLGFLAVCGVTIICMTVLIGIGKDGAITNALLGSVGVLFGANVWDWVRNKDTGTNS